MHQDNGGLIVKMADPIYEASLSCMRREAVNGHALSFHNKLFTKHFDGLGAIHQQTTERAARLKANEDKGIAFIPDALFEMLANAPAGAHATARDDDSAGRNFIDIHGVLSGDRQFELWQEVL